MAIRVVHAPIGAAGLAAFATGAGRARERKTKFALALNERANRFRTGARVGAAKPVAGQFGADPLAGLEGQEAIQIRSQQKRNARDRAAGRAPSFPNADRQFKPQAQIEAEAKKKIADDKFARDNAEFDRRRGIGRDEDIADAERRAGVADDSREDAQREKRFLEAQDNLDKGTHVLTPTAQRRIDANNAQLTGDVFNNSDEAGKEEIRRKIEDANREIIANGTEKSKVPPIADRFNDRIHTDESGQKWQEQSDGTFDKIEEAEPEPTHQEQKVDVDKLRVTAINQWKAQNPNRDDAADGKLQKAIEDIQKTYPYPEEEPEEVIVDKDALPTVDGGGTEPEPLTAMGGGPEGANADERLEETPTEFLDRIGANVPGPGAAPPDPGAVTRREIENTIPAEVSPEEQARIDRRQRIARTAANSKADALRRKPLPKGVPEGSEWISKDEILLPDGKTKIRPKRKK